MTQRKINVSEAVKLYEAGATSVELAKRYKASYQCILKALHKAGASIRPPRRGSTSQYGKKDMDRVVHLYQLGHTQAEVAKITHIGRGTVQRMLKARDIKARPRGLRAATIRIPDDPLKIGYIAGFLDADGNIQIRKKHGRKTSSGKIAIYNTEPAVMDWLLENVGGTVRWDHKRTERHGWKPIGIWEIYRLRDAERLLKAVLPLLIVKRKKALEVLEIIESKIS